MPATLTQTNKQETFRGWVHAYSDMLYSHAIHRGFDRDGAKDLVQETFYSAWKGMENFEGKASVKNWLFVILKNKITDCFRKGPRHAAVQLSEENFFDEKGHWAKAAYPRELIIDPSEPAHQIEFLKIFEGCSQRLSKIQKAVFFMKYVDDLESDMICRELAISANNYWTTLHRAKVQLRACMEKNWFLTKGI